MPEIAAASIESGKRPKINLGLRGQETVSPMNL